MLEQSKLKRPIWANEFPKNAPILAFVIGLNYRMFVFLVVSKPYPFNNTLPLE
jgi:hypothetical protein